MVKYKIIKKLKEDLESTNSLTMNYHQKYNDISSFMLYKYYNTKCYREASVLILMFPKNNDINFFLTKRSNRVAHHKGQISLPGGQRKKGETLQNTSMRETFEEIGVNISNKSILGRISPFNIPISRFRVYPFIAWFDHFPKASLPNKEVDKIITISLESLLDKSNIKYESKYLYGNVFNYPFYQFGNHKVWGATSMILSEFKSIIIKYI